jgi:hypothetical protein
LIDWPSRDFGVDQLGFENPDTFSPGAELDWNLAAAAPLDLQFSGLTPDYSLYPTNDLGANQMNLDSLDFPSNQTDLVLTPFNEGSTPGAE